MLAQRIRLGQIQEILTHDEGIDPYLKRRITLVWPTTPLLSYDHDLNELCNKAMAHGTAAGSIQSCLHIGVAHDEDPESAHIRSQQAATLAAIHTAEENPYELSSIRRELEQMLRPNQRLKAWTHLNANLRGMSDTPFVLWRINPAHKVSLVPRCLTLTIVFDLAGFIFLARQLGLTAELMTRKETEEETRDLSRRSIPRWGNRALRLNVPGEARMIMGAGTMTRMINELAMPIHVLKVCTRTAQMDP
jgi:hypothetical protein